MQGDSILNQALSEIGGKGLFTKELDVALLDKSVSSTRLSHLMHGREEVGGLLLPFSLPLVAR